MKPLPEAGSLVSVEPIMAEERRVRLVDVARAAGVSKASASLALRGDGKPVSPATVARVRAVAERLGFSPDPAARALALGGREVRRAAHYGTLAMLVSPAMPEAACAAYLSLDPSSSSVRKRAEELGHTLEMFRLPEDEAGVQRLVRVLRARGIRGLLVEFSNEPYLLPFPWEDFCVVALSRHPATVELHSVNSHGPTDVVQAVRQCRSLGYARIGLVAHAGWFSDWIAGYDIGVRQFGGGFEGSILAHSGWDADTFLRWWDRTRPDVVIANEGLLPLDALRSRGLRVPEDCGYCSLDVEGNAHVLSGSLQRKSRTTSVAVSLLHDLIRRGEPGDPIRIEVSAGWNPGTTLRAQA